MIRKAICLALAAIILGGCAMAAVPQLSGSLFSAAKQAVGYLAAGEYERLVTSLPFSGVAPSASEWERFAQNFGNLGSIQRDYAVAYWTGGGWRVAVPMQVPDSGSVEALVLTSDDGNTFSGYRYALWSQVELEYASSDHVQWNQEYVGNSPRFFAD